MSIRVQPSSWASRSALVSTIVPTTPPARAPPLRVGDRDSRVHEREVREPLWEVAEELARPRVDLLGVEPDIVREADELSHQLVRVVDAAAARVGVDEPERAGQERALVSVETVLPAVAVDVRPLAQLALDRSDRAAHPVAARVVVAQHHERQQARVELA